LRFILGTRIPRKISAIMKVIKINFFNFGKKQKYLFLANPTPTIFYSFAKRKDYPIEARSVMVPWAEPMPIK